MLAHTIGIISLGVGELGTLAVLVVSVNRFRNKDIYRAHNIFPVIEHIKPRLKNHGIIKGMHHCADTKLRIGVFTFASDVRPKHLRSKVR